jgi:hypothetical protein
MEHICGITQKKVKCLIADVTQKQNLIYIPQNSIISLSGKNCASATVSFHSVCSIRSIL